jgi:hypothetical protein
MAHAEEVVAEWTRTASLLVKSWLADEPPESLQRLDGIQSLVDELMVAVEAAAFHAVFELLGERAVAVAGTCRVCGLGCERERKNARVRTTRCTLGVEVWRYRCRPCRTSRSPVREWLGLESGMTTAGLDRALTALSTELSFGAAAAQMLEQHGHEVDRTLVERRTYAVGRDAATYLDERRSARNNEVMDAVGVREGTDQVLVQVDAGAVPVGQLERPERDATDPTQELTPVRRLPKGRRPKAKREVRVALAWQPGTVDDKVVDVHVAPHKHPEFTGDRMYCAALEAGMGDNTHVHGTFDMARWQVLQFEEQFGAQPEHSVCADFFHAVEYIAGAAKACQPDPEQVSSWLAMQARRLKEGQRPSILADLRTHECKAGRCPQTDKGECAVVAARRYLTRNGKHMDYPRFIAEGLPIGSGEVEGRIRHIVRRRLDVPGDWREDNLALITALITIRQSGWWDDFWEWQDERDKKRFRRRLLGEGLNRFRGPRKPRLITQGAESMDLGGLSPMFEGAAMA